MQLNVFWTRPQDYYDQAKWRGTWEFDDFLTLRPRKAARSHNRSEKTLVKLYEQYRELLFDYLNVLFIYIHFIALLFIFFLL